MPADDAATVPKTPSIHERRGRWVEDAGMIAGVVIALAYVLLVEALPTVAYTLDWTDRVPVDHPIPWILVIIVFICVAPKTISRAKIGDALVLIAGRFGKKVDG